MKMNDKVLNVYYLPGVQLIEQRKTTERRLGVLVSWCLIHASRFSLIFSCAKFSRWATTN